MGHSIAAIAVWAGLATFACDGDLRFPAEDALVDASTPEVQTLEDADEPRDLRCPEYACAEGEVCDTPTGICVVPCAPGTSCPGTTKCNPTLGICVECRNDGECSIGSGKETCLASVGRCVACGGDPSCPPSHPICRSDGVCAKEG